MPENDNQRRPLESIKQWRNRIKSNNRYGIYGGQLDESAVTATPALGSYGRIMSTVSKMNNDALDINELRSSIENIKTQEQVDSLSNLIQNKNIKQQLDYELNHAWDAYLSNHADKHIFPFIKDKGPNGILAQLYRKYSRDYGFQSKPSGSLGQGTDIIDLDKNVIRLTPTSQQSTGLFNEYIESKLPSVNKAEDYQTGKIKTFGDKYNIPTENISIYAGIEDGHFKLDSLKNFNPETIIYPARNIKKDVSRMTQLNVPIQTEAAKLLVQLKHQPIDDDYVFGNSYNTEVDEAKWREDINGKWLRSLEDHEFRPNWTSDYISKEYWNPIIRDWDFDGIDLKKYKVPQEKRLFRNYSYDEIQASKPLNNNLDKFPTISEPFYQEWKEKLPQIEKKLAQKDTLGAWKIIDPNDELSWISGLNDPDREETSKWMIKNTLNQTIKPMKRVLSGSKEPVPWYAHMNHPMYYFNVDAPRDFKYTYTDENGKIHDISDYNATILDSKMVLGDPKGGLFIGRIQDISPNQLNQLNGLLNKRPMWIIRPDLGSYAQYDLNNPSLQQYLDQYKENPRATDPNVFTVGTTEPNKLWE